MMITLSKRFHIRNKSVPAFLSAARSNYRYISYNLLPLIGSTRQRRILAKLISKLRPRPRMPRTNDGEALVRELRNDGLTRPLSLLSPTQLSEMRVYFENTKINDPWRPQYKPFYWHDLPSPEIRMGYYNIDQVLRAPHIGRLVSHPLVLETAERFLGCRPSLDNLYAWWSFPGHDDPRGTQRFHRDFDTVLGFKLFLYLTEVDEMGGPHVYVRGSNREEFLVVSSAVDDDTVTRSVAPDRVVKVTGPMGHTFLVDTFGIHKGLLPSNKARLIVSAQYSLVTSPHAPLAPIAAKNDPDFADLQLDSFVFRNYVA